MHADGDLTNSEMHAKLQANGKQNDMQNEVRSGRQNGFDG
jgi:hypothetical protein